MIDPREFKPTYPHRRGSFAAELHGDARAQWKAWYWAKRMERAGRPIAQGELGTFYGFTFVEQVTENQEGKNA